MTVVVAYKYASNPQDASVGSDGTVDWSRAKAAVSEYDPVAIQLGRNLAESDGSEVIGVSVGSAAVASSLAKKAAMSKGLDRGILVADDAVNDFSPNEVASVLAGLVKRVEDADVVITGDSSIDDGGRIMSGLVAGYLGWPCCQQVRNVEKRDGKVIITQSVSGGSRTISVAGPVVIAATSDAVTVKVPSRKEVLAAGKKPVEVVSLSDVDASGPRVNVIGRSKPAPKARKNMKFEGQSAVSDLVSVLRNDGIL